MGSSDTKQNASTFHCLQELLKSSSWKATEKVLSYVSQTLGSDTKAILLTGIGGTGKTAFIKLVTGEETLHVENTLKSGTTEYAVVPAVIDGRDYLLIDTPGFENADYSNLEVFKEITTGVVTISTVVPIVGVLYFAETSSDRFRAADAEILRWLSALCGREFFSNITIVTSKWDTWSQDSLHDKKEQLGDRKREWESILCPPGGGPGAQLYHHGIANGGQSAQWDRPYSEKNEKEARKEEAFKMISKNYKRPAPAELRILQEIKGGIPVHETSAANVLRDVRHEQAQSSTGNTQPDPAGPRRYQQRSTSTSRTPNWDNYTQDDDWSAAFQTAERWVGLLIQASLAYQRLRRGLFSPFTFLSRMYNRFTYNAFADQFEDPLGREEFEEFFPSPDARQNESPSESESGSGWGICVVM